MTHPGELLSAYLDGELTGDEERRVVDHLESCASCRMDLADLQSARAAVRSLPILDAPDWLRPARAGSAPAHRHPAAWVAAAAAVLVLMIGIAAWLTPAPSVELEFADIATTHRARVAQDGVPTGARVVQIAPMVGAAE